MITYIADTCSIVSAATCIEAKHRLEYETQYFPFRFPCRAAAPRELRYACSQQHGAVGPIWTPQDGADVGQVLWVAYQLGGIKTTKGPQGAPTHLPLRGWRSHYWDEPGNELTPVRIAQLMDQHGPFIGVIWVSPWYTLFDSRQDGGNLVYKSGCARDKGLQAECVATFGAQYVGLHAIVCFGYHFCGCNLGVHIIDNHNTAGPPRWIDSLELESVHVVEVDRLPPMIGLTTYPQSGPR